TVDMGAEVNPENPLVELTAEPNASSEDLSGASSTENQPSVGNPATGEMESIFPPDLRDKILALNAELNKLGLPIGFATLDDKPDNVSWADYNIYKALGILFTTIAITLGAQFWFDLLRMLTNRGSGK
ncbi:MAG: hypothetical protein ABI835_21950, partial [Chloroflexota bacterium]